MRHVKPPKVPENPPQVLRTEEIRALLDTVLEATVWNGQGCGIEVRSPDGAKVKEVGVGTDGFPSVGVLHSSVLGLSRTSRRKRRIVDLAQAEDVEEFGASRPR